jgi:hypothetical protein
LTFEPDRLSLQRPARSLSRARARALVAATALVLVLVAALAPSTGRAQQQPIPPVGEPPAPSPQEQAAIEEQVKQGYLQEHKDEFWKQAVSEVEQERKSAWEKRGRDQIPPSIVARIPGLELTTAARISALMDINALGYGVGAAGKLRMKKWWGIEAAGGIFSFRSHEDVPPPASGIAAPFAEVSAFGWLSGRGPKGYNVADHALLRGGFQLLFPVKNPTIPAVYLAPFAAFGASFALGQMGKRSYAALVFESRLTYRFGLGASQSSPIEGAALDILAGPAVGF